MLRLIFGFAAAVLILAVTTPDLTQRVLMLIEAPPPAAPAAPGAPARVMLTADRRGHFETSLSVNGQPTNAMIDTGASVVALTYEEGRKLGLVRPGDRYEMKMQTANGVSGAKRVSLNSVRIGGISVSNVDGIVAQEGALAVNLLGMSFLKRLRTFEIKNGRLTLEQ